MAFRKLLVTIGLVGGLVYAAALLNNLSMPGL